MSALTNIDGPADARSGGRPEPSRAAARRPAVSVSARIVDADGKEANVIEVLGFRHAAGRPSARAATATAAGFVLTAGSAWRPTS